MSGRPITSRTLTEYNLSNTILLEDCLGTHTLSYKDRLRLFGMVTLDSRRLHHDLLMTFKILFGMVDVNAEVFFTLANSGYDTRGHCYELLTNHSRIDVRKYFFAERIVHVWNSLAATERDCQFANF